MSLGAIGSVVGGLISAGSAKKAAKAQEAAANKDIAFQTETRDLIRNDLAPERQTGTNALATYNYLLGLGDAPTIGGTPAQIETYQIPGSGPTGAPGNAIGPTAMGFGGGGKYIGTGRDRFLNPNPQPQTQATTGYRVNGQTFATLEDAQAYANANKTGGTKYQGFQATPGYKFAFDQGTSAVNAMAGARGGLNSGRTMQDLTKFGQGIANQEFNNYLSRVGGLVDTGMSAKQMSGNASQNAAAGVSNALSAIGNAKAAGSIGVGNAFNGTITNLIGLNQYQKSLPGGGNGWF